MSLQVGHREIGAGVIVIQVAGRVMLGPESQRIETLTAELIEKGHRKFIFDMSGIVQIDSTGIGRFIAALNTVMKSGGRMHMAAAQAAVRDGFHVTRLDTVFKFFATVDEAHAGLG